MLSKCQLLLLLHDENINTGCVFFFLFTELKKCSISRIPPSQKKKQKQKTGGLIHFNICQILSLKKLKLLGSRSKLMTKTASTNPQILGKGMALFITHSSYFNCLAVLENNELSKTELSMCRLQRYPGLTPCRIKCGYRN